MGILVELPDAAGKFHVKNSKEEEGVVASLQKATAENLPMGSGGEAWQAEGAERPASRDEGKINAESEWENNSILDLLLSHINSDTVITHTGGSTGIVDKCGCCSKLKGSGGNK